MFAVCRGDLSGNVGRHWHIKGGDPMSKPFLPGSAICPFVLYFFRPSSFFIHHSSFLFFDLRLTIFILLFSL